MAKCADVTLSPHSSIHSLTQISIPSPLSTPLTPHNFTYQSLSNITLAFSLFLCMSLLMIPLSLSYPYPLICQHPLPPFSFNFPFPVLYFKLPMSLSPFRLTYPHFFSTSPSHSPHPLSQLNIPFHVSTPQATILSQLPVSRALSFSFNSPCPLPLIYPSFTPILYQLPISPISLCHVPILSFSVNFPHPLPPKAYPLLS